MAWLWSGFILFIVALVALDLGLFHRRDRRIKVREALAWSAAWVGVSLLFGAFIYLAYGNHWFSLGLLPDPIEGRPNDGGSAFLKYLTGYVVEKALSVDNLFVMAVLFRFLAVPGELQHRVLFLGILGALVLRGAMIVVGVELIAHYHWVIYVFGAFLLITAVRLLFLPERPPDPAHDPIVRLVRRFLPLTPRYDGHRFLTRENGRRVLTPLALALILIETSDVVFAVDSVPAVFAITADPFLVFSSNVLAILGLRSLYFAIAGLLRKFRYLKVSLAIILAVVGAKMLAGHWLKPYVGPNLSFYLLGLIALIFMAGIIVSILKPLPEPQPPLDQPVAGAAKSESAA
jgi:tellurite resistance protein TerC